MITVNTPWRSLGDVDFETWRRVIDAADGDPALLDHACYDAARGDTVLCLGMLEAESSYFRRFRLNKRENNNPLNLRPPSGDGYMAYQNVAMGIAAWWDRIQSLTYKGGIYARTVSIADLVNVYAPPTDNNDSDAYARKLCDRANAIFKEETMPTTLVFGNVTHPPFANRPIVKVEGVGQNDLGQRRVRGVTWHRMIGTLNGTDGWFRRPDVRALTDYGIGVMATDGPSLDGAIYRWNDPLGRQSGWASGVYSSAAYGDGAAFVATYGVDAINRDRASIEISGNYDTPLSDASRDAIARLTAYWADQARIPWDVFPIVPEDGFSFICWHNEFGPDFGQKVCPGSVVMQETAALIERTRAILKAGQLVETVTLKPQPVYAAPALPDWWESSIAQLWPSDVREGDIRYRVMRRNFEAVADTIRRSAPNVRAAPSGPKLRAGEKVRGERLVEADRQWVLTNDGHYVLASKLTPDVRVRTRRAA